MITNTICIYVAFWEREDWPFLIKFLESRLREGGINDAKTEHHSYKTELNIIAKYYAVSSEVAQKTQHVLDTTKEALSQNLTLQKTIIKQHLLGEPNVENLESIIGQKRNCGSAFPKNKDTNLDYDDHERRYWQNSPQKRQCTEPIADAENNPFFESENNLDKEKAKSKSQSISLPENENTHESQQYNDDESYGEVSNVEDESQQCNGDESYGEVSLNSYDEDHYSNCDLSEEVKHLNANDVLIRNIFLEVLHQF
ncbi:hypothetical protein RclHR1_02700005 [Rhizophagus clarus]|uniref:Uncharacterized protein n=1 Tax=Rhizophagus clarus TaxID=94130 RepID=A0A2Z6R1F2_9GLOM|nr:hypothetical protein RclHR1_02700005 [Rhizophagus clarus]